MWVRTESQYAYGLLALNWKPHSNIDLVGEIRRVADQFSDLKFVKVKGHAGILENERADALAVAAIEREKAADSAGR